MTSTTNREQRFRFGKNWRDFIVNLPEEKIRSAEDSLIEMLEVRDWSGLKFLDVGSGSGLFSLAARNLGAEVHSFDFDHDSVWCTRELKERFWTDDTLWTVEQGSVLDASYVNSLGSFDIVYSWGVLHHTGDLRSALRNVVPLVKKNGLLFIALYNEQPVASKYWTFVKKTYNDHLLARICWTTLHSIYPLLPSIIINKIRSKQVPRGMSQWHDLIDWLGGYPFETSTPQQIFDFFRSEDFLLERLKTVGGKLGCNEFVFRNAGAK